MNYALYIYDEDCGDWEFEQYLQVTNLTDANAEAKYLADQCAYRVRWEIRDKNGNKLCNSSPYSRLP